MIYDKDFILEGNKLIAEFLGYKYVPFGNSDDYKPGWWYKDTPDSILKLGHSARKLNGNWFLCRKHRDLLYFNSYDWIMKAIDKFEKMGCSTAIKHNYVRINPMNKGTYYNYITRVGFGKGGYYSVRNIPTDEESFNDEPLDYRGDEHIDKLKAIWLCVVLSIKWYNENC